MTDHDTLAVALEKLGTPRLLVLGDLMLDRYTTGRIDRVSPEAPALLLQADHHDARPGGAASVAALLRALDAEVTLAGVVGDDADGRLLRRLLDDAGVAVDLVKADSGRPTTVKERFLGRAASHHAQQILRVDRESRAPLAPALEAWLADAVSARIADYQAVLVSDYAKGTCTPRLLEAVCTAAGPQGIPVLVDRARVADLDRYRGATLLKPNRAQAELATGRPIVTVADALAAGRELCRRHHVAAVLVTLDRDGMVLVERDGVEEYFPTHSREVHDITGAGDMVLAVMGLCSDWPLGDAARLANVAAGLEVERLGVAPVTRPEMADALRPNHGHRAEKLVTPHRLAELVDHYRPDGKRTVFTNGCFDLLHAGHLACLEEAAQQGDVLIVAINSDASVRRLKGPGRPVVPVGDRAALLAGLACVDHVGIFDDQTPLALLQRLHPDVLVKGGTYTDGDVVGRQLVEGYGGRVHVTDCMPGRSTTELLAALCARRFNPNCDANS